jgi:membrane protein
VSWRDVWIGAGVTALLFTIGKVAIGLYIGKTDVASSFGTAGSLVIVMIWVYYASQIFLFGAELTRVYAETYGSRQKEAKERRRIESGRRRADQGLIPSPAAA